jgi:hypothetical protein
LIVALATLVAVALAVTAVASSSKHGAGGVVSASPSSVAPAAVVGLGWQSDFVYAVPTGAGGLFFHYACPGELIADGGKFIVDFGDPAANSVHLIGEGVRSDVPGKHEYQWNINWFGAGSPAGAQITFNVHCGKK